MLANVKKSCFLLTLCCCAWSASVRAESIGEMAEQLPANARGIDVEDKVGEFIPLELIFADERGNRVGLRKFFKQDKAVILTLNYSDCPGLCVAQLNNLVDTLRAMDSEGLGDRFEIVTVSIDPRELPSKAERTKAKYVGMLRSTKAEQAWHFLTGNQTEISALADAVGFRYTYDAANKRYNHPAATYFISSDGRICRYLLSLGVEPDQLKLAVAEAGEGKLTYSLSESFIQFCYLYDPDANRYSADARRLMAFGGAAFVMLALGLSAPFWFSGKKTPAAKAPQVDIANGEEQTDAYNTTIEQPFSGEPHTNTKSRTV
ncbi:MAG: SCO family protein [Pirellulaceae bacterium]